MADDREVAIALAQVLASTKEPEPFPVALRGQSLADAALIVRRLIRECTDAGVVLRKVEVGPDLMRHLRGSHLAEPCYLGVEIAVGEDLSTQLLLFRGRSDGGPA